MNNFWTRTLTGALFVVVMVFCIWYSYWTMAGLFFVIIILGLWEFYSLLEKANYHPQKYFALLIASLFFTSFTYHISKYYLGSYFPGYAGLTISVFGLILSLSIFFLGELFRNKEKSIVNISLTIAGLFYVLGPFA